MRHLIALLFLLLFAACSQSHPLAGAWLEERTDGAEGMALEFQIGGTKVLVHAEIDGHHTDIDGTYEFAADKKAVTVQAKLMGETKAGTWTGVVDGEHLTLSSADGKILFHHGEHVHGH